MGVGEGNNEMPDHLLDELRKRTIYYKSEAPKEIQVRLIFRVLGHHTKTPSPLISLANIHYEMADFAQERISSLVRSMELSYQGTIPEDL